MTRCTSFRRPDGTPNFGRIDGASVCDLGPPGAPAFLKDVPGGELAAQRVRARVNGELVQDQPVSELLGDVPCLIEYCSTFTALAPGDVIATGTPGGVGDKRNPPRYMKGGDRVEVSIGIFGTLSNPVIDET